MSESDAAMTSEGQVTMPATIRIGMGLRPGDHVEFQLLRDGSALLRPLNATAADLFAALRHRAAPVSLADIETAIAEAAAGAGEAGRKAGE